MVTDQGEMEEGSIQSPSGRYSLQIVQVPTRPGSWSRTLGIVCVRGNSDSELNVSSAAREIARVDRNYSSFPFTWVENHPNGHDYLVCGEDYQGQTVIELDTGLRRDHLPEDAAEGAGFCWADAVWNPQQQILVVDGCYWACPYGYKFYDFSEPMTKGWPEIELDNDYLHSDGKDPEIGADGIITVFETESKGTIAGKKWSDHDEADEERVVVATKTFKIVGHKLEKVSEWVDTDEIQRRAKSQVARDKWEQEWTEYKATNPIFLRVMEVKDTPPFKHTEYSVSTGICHDTWHPTEKFDDKRVCKRILEKPRDEKGVMSKEGWTIELEWGRVFAPIKLEIWKDGKYFDIDTRSQTEDRNVAKFFPLTLEGLNEALALASSIVQP